MPPATKKERGPPIDGAIGMMDAAYFTSRKDILDWLNDLLSLSLLKIEQTCTGAVACQLMDYMFPGSINLSKINWEARNDYDYVTNFKLVQGAFNRSNISKNVEVDRLVRGKYQDNLEFMQWFKAFFDSMSITREDYDPTAVRTRGKGGANAKKHMTDRAGEAGSKLLPGDRTSKSQYQHSSTQKEKKEVVKKDAGASVDKPEQQQKKKVASTTTKKPLKESSDANKPKATANPIKRTQSAQAPRAAAPDATSVKELGSLKKEHASLQMTVEGLEKERDFYFDKLRDVEVLLQAHQEKSGGNDPLIDNVFKVLYATSDDKISVTDNGELVGGKQEMEKQEMEEVEAAPPIMMEGGEAVLA